MEKREDVHIFLCDDNMPKWLSKLWEPWAGQCAGTLVVLKHDPRMTASAMSVLAHELVHARQCMTWGILQPIMYLLSSASCWMAGEDAYSMNSFEIAARRESGQKICK